MEERRVQNIGPHWWPTCEKVVTYYSIRKLNNFIFYSLVLLSIWEQVGIKYISSFVCVYFRSNLTSIQWFRLYLLSSEIKFLPRSSFDLRQIYGLFRLDTCRNINVRMLLWEYLFPPLHKLLQIYLLIEPNVKSFSIYIVNILDKCQNLIVYTLYNMSKQIFPR
jgi:hypothetical protein